MMDKLMSLPWRQQYAHIERGARDVLMRRDSDAAPLTTMELAQAIAPNGSTKLLAFICGKLIKMAANGFPFATHDGPEKMRFGRKVRGWQWRGQEEYW